MFDALTTKLTGVFQRLSGKGHLSEKDVDEALKEVRVALLEADVNFRVARDLVARVREKLVGTQVQQGLDPAQQVVKVVNEELTAVLSGGEHRLRPAPKTPSVIMLVGLQGSGKTTTVRLWGGTMQCPTCHNPHMNSGIGLVYSTSYGKLCVSCHKK